MGMNWKDSGASSIIQGERTNSILKEKELKKNNLGNTVRGLY